MSSSSQLHGVLSGAHVADFGSPRHMEQNYPYIWIYYFSRHRAFEPIQTYSVYVVAETL